MWNFISLFTKTSKEKTKLLAPEITPINEVVVVDRETIHRFEVETMFRDPDSSKLVVFVKVGGHHETENF